MARVRGRGLRAQRRPLRDHQHAPGRELDAAHLANQAYANARLTKFWTQIADHFKDYDDRLLFAGTNEIMFPGDYGTPPAQYYTVQYGFNQTFVDAVRATGGNNALRKLVVQGFNTNIDHTYNFFAPPNDSADKPADAGGALLRSVQLRPQRPTAASGNGERIATNPSVTETWANESCVDAQFQKMESRFVEGLGVPVILGEYGAILRTEYDSAQRYRMYWDEYITRLRLSARAGAGLLGQRLPRQPPVGSVQSRDRRSAIPGSHQRNR